MTEAYVAKVRVPPCDHNPVDTVRRIEVAIPHHFEGRRLKITVEPADEDP